MATYVEKLKTVTAYEFTDPSVLAPLVAANKINLYEDANTPGQYLIEVIASKRRVKISINDYILMDTDGPRVVKEADFEAQYDLVP